MQAVVCISDSPLAQAMMEALQYAYHDQRVVEMRILVPHGPGCKEVTFNATATMRFVQDNGLDGTITPMGSSRQLPFRVRKEPVAGKDTGDMLFFQIG